MSRKSISNGVSLKVENRSGFDKSFFNALTTGVGTLTPICKQLVIPNSTGKCTVKISAQLPPLATDAFLRTHLKLEAFWTPLRLCYGGFESWFCGREIWVESAGDFGRAQLPRLAVIDYSRASGQYSGGTLKIFDDSFGAGSLLDYFGVYWNNNEQFVQSADELKVKVKDVADRVNDEPCRVLNIFPHLCYALIYDEYYRNKLVEKPLFAPPVSNTNASNLLDMTDSGAWALPFISSVSLLSVFGAASGVTLGTNSSIIPDTLLNGSLCDIRQRNYGDDYFTCGTPNAQEGVAANVSVISNQFSISALRLANSMQEFREASNFASPDYIQTLSVRYGASLKAGIAQKPVLVGSADFPMYTSGVEQTAQSAGQSVNNPFNTVGTRYGRAHAEGTDFVCEFNADEPGYFMVIASLVPEAQYFRGVAKDMSWFTRSGSLVDLPCGLLEHIGNEAITLDELDSSANSQVFAYVQRYLAHKLGNRNQVHGLFRMDESLGSFVVQRDTQGVTGIDSSFLKVSKTDLDNVAAVSSGVSQYGVMIDSAVELFVSEPLTESAIPSLSNPATEHGRSVYVKTAGSKLS